MGRKPDDVDVGSRFRGAAVLDDGPEIAAIVANAARRRRPEGSPA
jgi:hypothetical protein